MIGRSVPQNLPCPAQPASRVRKGEGSASSATAEVLSVSVNNPRAGRLSHPRWEAMATGYWVASRFNDRAASQTCTAAQQEQFTGCWKAPIEGSPVHGKALKAQT